MWHWSDWWGVGSPLPSDLALCCKAASAQLCRVHSTHSHLGNDSHSKPWHHPKEKMMIMKGGGECLPLSLQNLCSIPADAPTFSSCQEDRQEEENHPIQFPHEEKSRRSQTSEIVMLPAGANKWGRRAWARGWWSRVCESTRSPSWDRTNHRWARFSFKWFHVKLFFYPPAESFQRASLRLS